MSNLFVKFITVVVCLLGGNAIAQEPGKLTPLPDKLPSSVEARVGKVEFNKGLPTQKGIEQLFEIHADTQRRSASLTRPSNNKQQAKLTPLPTAP